MLAYAKGFLAGLFSRRKKTIPVIVPPTWVSDNYKAFNHFNPAGAAVEIKASLELHGIQATVLTPEQFGKMYDCDAFELATKRMVAELVCENYEPNSCDQHQRPVVVDGVQAGILHYARIGCDFFFFKERFSGDSDDVLANYDGFLEWQAKVDFVHDEFWDRIHGEGENE